MFDERIFKRAVPAETFRRGRDYFLAGAVTEARVERNPRGDYAVRGKVIGTRPHETSLTVAANKETIIDHACNCHEAELICKHVVALGLAAPEVGEAYGRGQISARSNAMRSARVTAKRKMLIGSGAGIVMEKRGPGPRIKQEQHLLDEIRIRLSYDKKIDALFIEAIAIYGPFTFSLFGPEAGPEAETRTDERGVMHEAWRDADREEECRQWFLSYLDPDAAYPDGRLPVKGEQIYWFVKETLPELDFRYLMDVDAAAKPIIEVKEADVESDWSAAGAGGGDLFAFSVDWHCANVKVSPRDLKEMVQDHRPFLRNADGSFIECRNAEEVESLVGFLTRAKKTPQGMYSANLFNAPGMIATIEQSHSARLATMTETFERFLDEVKTGRPVEATAIPEALDRVLRPYQKDGVAWELFLQKYHFGGILADDMGLGKTLQVLVMLKLTKDSGAHPGPSLILCPKTVMGIWADEAARFVPDLKILVVDGTAEERERLIAQSPSNDVVVTSYSLYQRDFLQYGALAQPFVYIVLDEAQYIKNAGTNTAKAVKLIPSSYRLAITGTPLENGVHELWSIFDFLMPGFLGNTEDFRRQYERPISEHNDGEALLRLKRKVQPFMLRRTKSSELKELPPKIEQTSSCQLSPEQLIVYARTLESVRKDVFASVEEKGFERSRIEILSALMKLRRVCDHPALVDPRLPQTEELSGKMAHAMELVREAVSGGHKVLLFSQFTTMLDILRASLEGQGIGHCTIEGKTRDRAEQVRKFERDPNANVFLLSLRAGGTGLTLTAADTVILYDPWWNPMVEQQAMDRAHRIGQLKTVNVYKLITKNTIEDKVVALQERKKQIFDALMTENAAEIRNLTWEDLKGLFA